MEEQKQRPYSPQKIDFEVEEFRNIKEFTVSFN